MEAVPPTPAAPCRRSLLSHSALNDHYRLGRHPQKPCAAAMVALSARIDATLPPSPVRRSLLKTDTWLVTSLDKPTLSAPSLRCGILCSASSPEPSAPRSSSWGSAHRLSDLGTSNSEASTELKAAITGSSIPSIPGEERDAGMGEEWDAGGAQRPDRPLHVLKRKWHLRTRDAAREGPKSMAITVHGCVSDEDAEWLKGQVGALRGVREVFVQGRKEGGLRGGAVQLQLEVDPSVRLPALVDAVHGVEERLLALPFKSHLWMWKGHRISYAVAGCGRPVILVHGFGGSAGHFRNLIAQLADDHRVYAVDLLGFGNSDKPGDVEYGPQLWADIINDFAQEFAEEPPVLVGNSIGSLTALAAAKQMTADAEASVRGLVLLNVAGAMNRKGLMQDDIILRAMSPVFIAVEFLLQKPRVASWLFERFRSKANIRKILSEQVYKNRRMVDERLIDILLHPSQHEGALDVFVKVFLGDPGPRPEALVQDLDVPMLVLWGDADPWTPINGKVAQIFRRLEQERDNVSVVPLPNVGHCPHDDHPELAASHILPWLESLDSAEL